MEVLRRVSRLLELDKGFDPEKHPRHPAGTEDVVGGPDRDGGKFSPGDSTGAGFTPAESAETFIAARNESKRQSFLSPLEPGDLAEHELYVGFDGHVGFALSPDGDVQNVFNNGGPKGAGAEAIFAAIDRGGRTLDAYAGFLPAYYGQFGFVETGRMKFDKQYAPPGWDESLGEPDVVFMAWQGYNGESKDEIRRRIAGPGDKWRAVERSGLYYSGDAFDQAKLDARGRAHLGDRGKAGGPRVRGAKREADTRTGAPDRRAVVLSRALTRVRRLLEDGGFDESKISRHPAGTGDVVGDPERDGGKFAPKDGEASAEDDLKQYEGLVHPDQLKRLTRKDIERQAKLEREQETGIAAITALIETEAAGRPMSPAESAASTESDHAVAWEALPAHEQDQTYSFYLEQNGDGDHWKAMSSAETYKLYLEMKGELTPAAAPKSQDSAAPVPKSWEDLTPQQQESIEAKYLANLSPNAGWGDVKAKAHWDEKSAADKWNSFKALSWDTLSPGEQEAAGEFHYSQDKGISFGALDDQEKYEAFMAMQAAKTVVEPAAPKSGWGSIDAKSWGDVGPGDKQALENYWINQGGSHAEVQNFSDLTDEQKFVEWQNHGADALKYAVEIWGNKSDDEEEEEEPTESDLAENASSWDDLPSEWQEKTAETWMENEKADYIETEKENWWQTDDPYHRAVENAFDPANEKLRENFVDRVKATLTEDLGYDEELVDRVVEDLGDKLFGEDMRTLEKEASSNPYGLWDSTLSEGWGDNKAQHAADRESYTALLSPEAWYALKADTGLKPIDPDQLELIKNESIVPPWAEEAKKLSGIVLSTLADEIKSDPSDFDVEVPDDDYFSDSVKDYMGDLWSNKSDEEKFDYWSENLKDDYVGEETTSSSSGSSESGVKWDLQSLATRFVNGKLKLNDTDKDAKVFANKIIAARAGEIGKERGIMLSPEQWQSLGNNVWDNWKGSSTDPASIAFQLAVHEELGAHFRAPFEREEILARADEGFRKLGMGNPKETLKVYARALWETTQWVLAKEGREEINLARAIIVDDYERLFSKTAVAIKTPWKNVVADVERVTAIAEIYDGDQKNYYTKPHHSSERGRAEKLPWASLSDAQREVYYNEFVHAGSDGDAPVKLPRMAHAQNAAMSFTEDVAIANKWGGVDTPKHIRNPTRVVLRTRVPKTSVLSVPLYGKNVHGEREWVITGTPVISWDAWLRKAPAFETHALESLRGVLSQVSRLLDIGRKGMLSPLKRAAMALRG